MFKYSLKIALRNILKYKGYSLVNIIGLSIGMAIFILIILFVQNEFSYDGFHENPDRIYRLELGKRSFTLPQVIGREVREHIPEALEVVTFERHKNSFLEYNEKLITIENFVFTDVNVFDVFTFSMVKGNRKTALKNPYSVVLTKSVAKKLFGEEEPVGKTVRFDNRFDFKITGIIEDVKNSHMQIDTLAAAVGLDKMYGQGFVQYGNWSFPTYLLLPENHNIERVERKINDHFNGTTYWRNKTPDFRLRPLKDIYFSGRVRNGFVGGNLQLVYILIAISIFILLIACINFINITTARASIRAKEIGIKKVVGSQKSPLILQFLTESIVISLLALISAIVLVGVLLPVFESLISVQLHPIYYSNPPILLLFIVGAVIVGLISGIYPAFYLTSFHPITVLKGERTKGKSAAMFRKTLTVFQYSISIILIIATLTVMKQLKYMKNRNMGFDRVNIVNLKLNEQLIWGRGKSEIFKEKLLQNPDILQASYSCSIPGKGFWGPWVYDIDGKEKRLGVNSIDPEFFNLLGVKMVLGRNFSWDIQSDKQAFILNESAVKTLELESPLGKILKKKSQEWIVIGVVKDFHFNSMHYKLQPLGFHFQPGHFRTASLKISSHNISKTIRYIERTWEAVTPGYPFNYTFFEESLDLMYKKEERLTKIFGYFALLAILIASIGLFGLAAYMAQRRIREIGIRRVFGASISNVMLVLLKDFTRSVVVANIAAWPIAYIILSRWLQLFPYHTTTGIWIFIASAILSLLIALITVSFQSIKAAHTDPVEALRYE